MQCASWNFSSQGKEDENINYWHSTEDSSVSSPDDPSQSCSDAIPKQGRPRILGPKDEFFLTPTKVRVQRGTSRPPLWCIPDYCQSHNNFMDQFYVFEIHYHSNVAITNHS